MYDSETQKMQEKWNRWEINTTPWK